MGFLNLLMVGAELLLIEASLEGLFGPLAIFLGLIRQLV